MAKVYVKLRGEDVIKLTLESGHEYIAGRAQDAQIQLAGERGISRHHLKFYERDGTWVCESLSKFLPLQKGDQSMEVIELREATSFSVPPYEFHFEPSGAAKEPKTAAASSENLPAFFQAPPSVAKPESADTAPRANNDATMGATPAALVPYLRVSYPNTADDEVLKLEGQIWIGGRDPSCEIPIESPNVSRKHFELARMPEGFFITDLGSSNGTRINGQAIPPHEPKRLESGDEIQIKNITIAFEIRDSHFNHRVESLPVAAFDPMLAAPPVPWYQPEGYDDYKNLPAIADTGQFPALRDWKQIRWKHFKAMGPKKLVIRGGVALGALMFVIMSILPGPAPKTPAQDKGGNSLTFEKLSPEQKSTIKDSFNLARSLYVQGKYETCLTELAKVHELIPQYENSKELQSFCEQGKELVQKQLDAQRKERERQQIEQQISGIVDDCKHKLSPKATVDETRTCLAPAMELDPEHHLIVEMISAAQVHEKEQQEMEVLKAEEEQKRQKGLAHFNRAKDLYKEGRLAKALREYESFVKTPYPNLDDNKNSARREIASIKKELQTKVESLLDQCKSLGSKGQFRDAYLACDKAVKEEPSNEGAQDMREHMKTELHRELKSIYEDSTLEESLGNVDSAKEKWKRIEKEDIPDGDYAKKAHVKLQKYGWEL